MDALGEAIHGGIAMRWPWSKQKTVKLDFGCACSVLVIKFDAGRPGHPNWDAGDVMNSLDSMYDRGLDQLRAVTVPDHIEIQVIQRFSSLVHICTLQGAAHD